ncbi:hypothetical protein IAT40_001997 [Kwoniella sp. CBS 6097]
MVRYIAFGNNVCGNLDAADPSLPSSSSSAAIIDTPREIAIEGEIVFHSWCCTVIKEDGRCLIKGIDALSRIDFVPRRVIGFDRPVGFILQDGTVVGINGKGNGKESTKWHDAVVTGLGRAYAVTVEGIKLDHPLLKKNKDIKLYATESRAFILISTRHLLEIIDLRSVPGGSGGEGKELRLIEEVEGVGIKAFIPGSANRAGVLTEGGEAWLLPARGDPELLEIGNGNRSEDGDGDRGSDDVGEEVRLMGVGADFEVVDTDRAVYVRGSNNFGQLGLPGITESTDFIPLDIDSGIGKGLTADSDNVIGIHTARWSSILVIK